MHSDSGITIGLKTFLRPDKLRTCLASIRDLPVPPEDIIIADDSPQKEYNRDIYAQFKSDLPLTIVDLKPDAGLATGRNRILDQTETDYLLLIDDDHYLSENIFRLKNVLENDPSLGGVAASWLENGTHVVGAADIRIVDDWVIVDVFDKKQAITDEAGVTYFKYDFIPNSTLFRTEVFDAYCWDEAYVIDGEHVDFFLGHALQTDWEFAISPEIQVTHDPGPGVMREYAEHRMSDQKRRQSREYFAKKWDVQGYLIREYHSTEYGNRVTELAARTLYKLPPSIHWELKQRGHLDRAKTVLETVTSFSVN
ncbi:glycosyltransferase family 2 protein [Natrinema salinisoli]|uniref:glycosyltransferase family 2 protein n=1 Tax=Natrinema salinisoli TaxID=2878535 RepID=UPI001CEFDC2B|nr:glycosyltransferase [Natrinema salinisoli]